MSFVEAIAAKRDGEALDRAQIDLIVDGASRGSLPPEQLAAMLMAISSGVWLWMGRPTGAWTFFRLAALTPFFPRLEKIWRILAGLPIKPR